MSQKITKAKFLFLVLMQIINMSIPKLSLKSTIDKSSVSQSITNNITINPTNEIKAEYLPRGISESPASTLP